MPLIEGGDVRQSRVVWQEELEDDSWHKHHRLELIKKSLRAEKGGQRLLLGDPHLLPVCMENMKEEYRSDRFGFLSPVSVASGWMEIHFHKIHVKLAVFPCVPSPFKWLSE